MKKSCFAVFSLIAVSVLGLNAVQTCRVDGAYHFLKEIPVGGEGAWDYLKVDPEGRRLYVAHATEVVVIDLDNNTVVGTITNTLGVHGFAIAPKLHRGYASDGHADMVSVVDLPTLQTINQISTGKNPDCIMFEPRMNEVYAFNGHSQSVTVFGADSGKVSATIPLPGKPEFAAADPRAGRVYDNIEDQSEVAVIDIKTHQIAALWPIAPGESASGMALDAKHHRLFVGCDNNLMLMLNTEDGKVLASVPIGEGIDADAFDPKTGLAFASCGDGTVTIAKEDGDTLRTAQTLKTEQELLEQMALDPKTHNIYLATAEVDASAPPGKHGRPKFLPGTFKILVYGPGQTP